ncbi:MAG: hypothetical protein FD174_2057 [Geobacteraceae bacterium]|nr:MAG: hypothetical protein FD174_2057 [Geobacteraceae bacterium]
MYKYQYNPDITELDIIKYHNLNLSESVLNYLLNHLDTINLTSDDLSGKKSEQINDTVLGEYFAMISRLTGTVASKLLGRAQWGYDTPEWFDHRHHLFNPEKNLTDFFAVSAENIIKHLPLDGKVLDLCSGDGFYDYFFFRKRAKEIVCVDINSEAMRYAIRNHSADNITYIQDNVLTLDLPDNYYDVVLIRGAIEHFSESDQQIIFSKAKKTLQIGGWFCGDTVANSLQEGVLLASHENEWANEEEMRTALAQFFEHIETSTLTSRERVTLLWACKKHK